MKLIPTNANLAMVFIARFFKAGCKLVSLSRMAFPPVLFMSGRLRYLLDNVQYLAETLLSKIRRGKRQ